LVGEECLSRRKVLKPSRKSEIAATAQSYRGTGGGNAGTGLG
jgi:hypothetical protein